MARVVSIPPCGRVCSYLVAPGEAGQHLVEGGWLNSVGNPMERKPPIRQGDTPLIRVLVIHGISGLGRVLDQLCDPAVHLGAQIQRESAVLLFSDLQPHEAVARGSPLWSRSPSRKYDAPSGQRPALCSARRLLLVRQALDGSLDR